MIKLQQSDSHFSPNFVWLSFGQCSSQHSVQLSSLNHHQGSLLSFHPNCLVLTWIGGFVTLQKVQHEPLCSADLCELILCQSPLKMSLIMQLIRHKLIKCCKVSEHFLWGRSCLVSFVCAHVCVCACLSSTKCSSEGTVSRYRLG